MKTSNIKWTCVVLLGWIFSSFAEDKFINPQSLEDSTQSFYENGVQFYFINGVSFALKTRSSYPQAWRLLCDLSGSLSDGSQEYRQKNSNGVYQEQEDENDRHDFNFSLSFQYNHFFNVKNYFDPYVGIGPLLSYGIRKGKYESKETIGGDVTRTDKTTDISLGIGVLSCIGIESSLLQHLSLFSELNLSYTYEWWKSERDSKIFSYDSWQKYEATGKTNILFLDSIKLGLIVYF